LESDATEAAPPEAADAIPPALESRRLTGDRVNLREGAGTDQRVLAVLAIGSDVQVIEAEGDWLRVRTASGLVGWVAARFVAPAPD
jgi:SH3-like domain-containing protein